MRPRQHQPVVRPCGIRDQDLVAGLDEGCDGRGDPSDTTDRAVDVRHTGLDPVHAVELGGDSLAEAEQAGRRRVLDLAVPRELDRGLHNVLWCREIGFTNLEPDAARGDERKIDDLADSRMRCFGWAGRDCLQRKGGRGFYS